MLLQLLVDQNTDPTESASTILRTLQFSINIASEDPSWIKTVKRKNRFLKRMSDAVQKPMESDAADEQLECDCGAGKTCPVKGVIDSTFKTHYRGQMIDLMTTIIDAACDPNHDSTGDTKRVKNIKNEMDVVRSLTDSWPDLTSMFITGRDSICITTRKILDVCVNVRMRWTLTRFLSVYLCNRFMYVADRKKL